MSEFTCEPLPLGEWESLRPIFNEEFDSALPNHNFGAIIVIKDQGKTVGFVSLESLISCMAYINPEYRHTGAMRTLFSYAEQALRKQSGRSALIVTEKDNVGRLANRFGMREIGRAWRIDL